MNFWTTLQKPIMALAPMANVTDEAFRRIITACGKPAVFWTEFVSVEGLLSRGKEKLLIDFWYTPAERPIVAQIFGSKPDQFERVGALARELGFDGVDINMGCPDKGVEKSGGGAAMMKNHAQAKEVIRALRRGAGDLPVSVKTRMGYAKNEIAEWIPALLEEDLATLSVHLRTRNEMSNVPAHWELARDIVEIRDKYAPQTLLLGNGDIKNLEEARVRVHESGMDGVMLGRGIFGNPWLFAERVPSIRERLEMMIKHTELYETLFKSNLTSKEGGLKDFDMMKKHYKAYANGFDGAKDLRVALMTAHSAADVRRITEEFLVGTSGLEPETFAM